MAQLMDYTRYLAKEIGPRPAGTEEEQQAALYITEQFQKEAGFTSNIEEFSSSSNLEGGRAILAGVTIVVTILAMIFPVLSIFAFVLATAAAVIYVLEMLDRPIISRGLARGASQNVVAKYQPNPDAEASGRTRSRKLVLVAHYDTGRVKPALVSRFEGFGVPWGLVCVIGMAAAAFFLLLRIFIATSGGGLLVVLNILSVLALLVCLLPVVKTILVRTSPYNEGANNNATGTAALIEVARRISRGSVSEADLADGSDGVVIHGEEAARSAGLVPEGAQILYEAENIVPPAELGEYGEEERLIAAKAAIAALTGKPVERHAYGSVADNLVNARTHDSGDASTPPADGGIEPMPEGQAARQAWDGAVNAPVSVPASADWQAPAAEAAAAPAPAATASTGARGFENAPSWFVAAQRNAKRSESDSEGEIHRSRYTEAIERGERERHERELEQQQLEEERREEERRMREEQVRASIMGQAAADASAEQAEVAEAPAQPDEPALAGMRSHDAFADLTDDAAFAGEEAEEPLPAVTSEPLASEVPPVIDVDAADAEPSDPDQTRAFPGYGQIDAQAEQRTTARRTISVPELDAAGDSAAEPAPARRRISQLPAIGSEPEQAPAEDRSDRLRSLRASVPSLSGIIRTQNEARQAVASSLPSVMDNPAAPAPSEPERIMVSEDVDYDMEVPADLQLDLGLEAADGPESDAPAPEPSGMDMPKSRAGGLLNRFRRKSGDDLEETPQEWLDVDEDFDARSVGAARGSWESFRTDDPETGDPFATDDFGEFGTDEPRSRRSWEGGAYSRMSLGHVDMRSGEDAEADEIIPAEPPEDEVGRSVTGEIEQIYHFRNPSFNTEVWFVAIGSDTESHDGAKAFLEEHASELRGSMVIEVESLGAGELSYASQEGMLRKVTASSRIKRLTRDAVAKTGIRLGESNLSGADSISSTIQKAGFQSMHLFGAEDGRPALKGSSDDVLENIDERLFDDHVNFIFELLKSR